MTTTYTVTATPLLAYSLQKMADETNAARPLDGEGQPIGPAITAQGYLQSRVTEMLQDYARRHARISGAAFIDRFTAPEWARLKAARAANPALAEAAAPLLQGQRVELAGPLAQQGVAMLAAIPGMLDAPAQERAAALLAPPQPGEAV